MKILVCGVGAIGSNLTARLVSDLKGLHTITILDKDTVEERNVTPGTQLYMPDQVGLSKVEALQYNIYKMYQREVNIMAGKAGRGGPTLDNHDIIIDCFDNYISRNFLQEEYARIIKSKNISMLHVGFSDRFTYAIEWAENYKVPSDITTGFDICEMEGASAFVNSVASLGALVAEEFINHGKKLEIVGGKFSLQKIL